MKIKVTENHIKNGKQHDIIYCPVALALCEVNNKVVVSFEAFWIGNARYVLPDIVKSFILDFDFDRLEVKPFEFEIDIKENDVKT